MITTQRTLQQPFQIVAIVHNRGRIAAYNLTDSSLDRIERIAVQKTTRRFVSMASEYVIENSYFVR